MCVFIPIAMAVMAAASTAMQIKQQNDTASAQAKAANNAATADYQLLNRKQGEIGEKAALEETERMRQGRRERAMLNVSMGEAGVQGIAPIRQQAASYVDQSWDVGIMESNKRSNLAAAEDEKRKTYTDAQGRVNMAKSNVVSPLMAGLQIGGAGLKGYLGGKAAI